MDEINQLLDEIERIIVDRLRLADILPKLTRLRELVHEERARLDKMSWAHVEALDCLMDLYTVQNGCPLPGKYDEAWTAAMRRAEALLGIEAQAGEDDHERD